MWESVETSLYSVTQWANGLVEAQLSHLGAPAIAIVFLAGLLTSLTPCMLSMLPIAIGYIGGYSNNSGNGNSGNGETSERSLAQAAAQSSWFALGLATTLALMGIISAGIGQVYGQVGFGLPIVVSLVAIAMGLNLLELLPLRFPSFDTLALIPDNVSTSMRSYLVGLTFGLVASPCSTPVLATLLAWVGSTGKPVMGGVLLFAYAIGYVFPLVLAGTFTASLEKLLDLRRWSTWITPTSGALLLGFGTLSLINRLPLNWLGSTFNSVWQGGGV